MKDARLFYALCEVYELCRDDLNTFAHLMERTEKQFGAEALERLKMGVIRVEEQGANFIVSSLTGEKTIKPVKVRKQDIAPWVQDTLALLRLIEPGEEIPELGHRYSESVFYLDQKENFHERRQSGARS